MPPTKGSDAAAPFGPRSPADDAAAKAAAEAAAREQQAREALEAAQAREIAQLRADLETLRNQQVEDRQVRADAIDELKGQLDAAKAKAAETPPDVLTARLTARLDAVSHADGPGGVRLMELLGQEAAEARAAMLTALREARYLRLLDMLVGLAAAPPFIDAGQLSLRTSRKMATKILEKPWRRVADAVSALGGDPSDAQLHEVRILAKRSRYAAEATAPLLGPATVRFAAAVADVQTVLGDHQDTVLAEEWLLRAQAKSPGVRDTVGELIAMERSRRAALRAQWPAVWQRGSTKKMQ